MNGAPTGIGAMTLVTVQRDGVSVGGTVLPSFGSPHLFPSEASEESNQGWE